MEFLKPEYILALTEVFVLLSIFVAMLSGGIAFLIFYLVNRVTETKLTYHPEMFDNDGHVIREELLALTFVNLEDEMDDYEE